MHIDLSPSELPRALRVYCKNSLLTCDHIQPTTYASVTKWLSSWALEPSKPESKIQPQHCRTAWSKLSSGTQFNVYKIVVISYILRGIFMRIHWNNAYKALSICSGYSKHSINVSFIEMSCISQIRLSYAMVTRNFKALLLIKKQRAISYSVWYMSSAAKLGISSILLYPQNQAD